MLLDILYNFYDYINKNIIDTFVEIIRDSSCFSDVELDNLTKYINSINVSHNLHIIIDHLDDDHIIFVYNNEIYTCVHKIRDHLYVTKISYEKCYRFVKTMSELYDVVTIMAISEKLKNI